MFPSTLSSIDPNFGTEFSDDEDDKENSSFNQNLKRKREENEHDNPRPRKKQRTFSNDQYSKWIKNIECQLLESDEWNSLSEIQLLETQAYLQSWSGIINARLRKK